jgi:hypothetical protein
VVKRGRAQLMLGVAILAIVVGWIWYGAPERRVVTDPVDVIAPDGPLVDVNAAAVEQSSRQSTPDSNVPEDPATTALRAHVGATDAARDRPGGVVLRFVDAEGTPMRRAFLGVSSWSTEDGVRERGITDDDGRLRTSIDDVEHVLAVHYTEPQSRRTLQTRHWTSRFDVANGELPVRLPHWRDVELTLVDVGGRSMNGFSFHVEPDPHAAARPAGALVLTPTTLASVTTDDAGVARFRAAEGVHALGFHPSLMGSGFAWLIVTEGSGVLRDTLVLLGTEGFGWSDAATRDLRVHVVAPSGDADSADVEVVVPPSQAATGSLDESGVLFDAEEQRATPSERFGATYEFHKLPRTAVTVRVRCRGCEPFSRVVDVTTDELRVELRATGPSVATKPTRLRGVVVQEDGTPIAGATVSSNPGWHSSQTSDGRFELTIDEPSILTVRHDDFATAIVGPFDPTRLPEECRVVLHRRVGLTGVVRFGTATLSDEISVIALRLPEPGQSGASETELHETGVEADGTFAFPDLRAGSYDVRAVPHPASNALRGRVVVDSGEYASIVLGEGLGDGDLVTGVVRDRDTGRPIEGALVTLCPVDGALNWRTTWSRFASVDATTTADGTFRCFVEARGQLWLRVVAIGFAFHSVSGDGRAMLETPQRIELVRETRLRLRIRMESGASSRGVSVGVAAEDGTLRLLRFVARVPVKAQVVGLGGRIDLVGVPRERVTLVIGRDLDDPAAPRHRVEVDARSVGDEIVDVVVPW